MQKIHCRSITNSTTATGQQPSRDNATTAVHALSFHLRPFNDLGTVAGDLHCMRSEV